MLSEFGSPSLISQPASSLVDLGMFNDAPALVFPPLVEPRIEFHIPCGKLEFDSGITDEELYCHEDVEITQISQGFNNFYLEYIEEQVAIKAQKEFKSSAVKLEYELQIEKEEYLILMIDENIKKVRYDDIEMIEVMLVSATCQNRNQLSKHKLLNYTLEADEEFIGRHEITFDSPYINREIELPVIEKNDKKESPELVEINTTNDKVKTQNIDKNHQKSRLFPNAVKQCIKETPKDERKAFIVDDRVLSFPNFVKTFKSFRIIVRQIKYADFEISDSIGLVLNPAENYFIEKLPRAMLIYDNMIIIFIPRENQINKYILSHNLSYREFATYDEAYKYICSIIPPTNNFLRDSESLLENLLTLFPTVSSLAAQKMLHFGEPFSNYDFPPDLICPHVINPFFALIDKSSSYSKVNEAKSKLEETNDNPGPNSLNERSNINQSCKVSAPPPSYIDFLSKI